MNKNNIVIMLALAISFGSVPANAAPETCPLDIKKSGDTCACPKGSESIQGTCVKNEEGKLVCKCSY